MTKLKKFLLVMTLGAGVGMSLSAVARPGCDTCNSLYTSCQGGNATSCANFDRYGCDSFSGDACAIF